MASVIAIATIYLNVNTILKSKIISVYHSWAGHIRPAAFLYMDYIPYFAFWSSSSSIRNNWLYFAMRSVRDIEPVLI